MSFYINNSNPNKPGPICGNPTNGICEKIMIETTKVFDACICSSTEKDILLPLSNLDPASPELPLTFISAENKVDGVQKVEDLIIDRLESCPNYANVSFKISIPVTVTYRDANGKMGTGESKIVVNKSVLLFVPQPSMTPVNVSATATFNSQIGTFLEATTFSVTGCIQIIIKVKGTVDVLVPSYGYPILPPCQCAPSQSACPGFADLPIYPTASSISNIPKY